MFVLQQAMVDEMFPRIMKAANAKEAWDTLHEKFQGNTKVCVVKLQTPKRDFENLKTQYNKTTKDHYSRVKEVVNQLRAYREDIS